MLIVDIIMKYNRHHYILFSLACLKIMRKEIEIIIHPKTLLSPTQEPLKPTQVVIKCLKCRPKHRDKCYKIRAGLLPF